MLKIIAMLLVIATVVFAAGCAEKEEAKNTSEPTVAGEHTSEEVDAAVVEPGNETVELEAENATEPAKVAGEAEAEELEPGNVTELAKATGEPEAETLEAEVATDVPEEANLTDEEK
jgi:hypothetical protein